eukprot:jgi/Psemu1/284704/fgenesh1_pg.61_\
MSTFFPKSLEDIYRGVCTWQRIHFKTCRHIPKAYKDLYWQLKDSDRTRGKKVHWIKSAYDMGFRNVDEHRNGVLWEGPAAQTNKAGKGRTARRGGEEEEEEEVLPPPLPGVLALDLTKPFDQHDDGNYNDNDNDTT